MKTRTLFEWGDLAGPWWVQLSMFDEPACLMGVSWHRYLKRLDICLDLLPFVTLRIVRTLARRAAAGPRARCLFKYSNPGNTLHLSALILPHSWTLGTNWYRDAERFELVVHPLPTLALFYTRAKGESGDTP